MQHDVRVPLWVAGFVSAEVIHGLLAGYLPWIFGLPLLAICGFVTVRYYRKGG